MGKGPNPSAAGLAALGFGFFPLGAEIRQAGLALQRKEKAKIRAPLGLRRSDLCIFPVGVEWRSAGLGWRRGGKRPKSERRWACGARICFYLTAFADRFLVVF